MWKKNTTLCTTGVLDDVNASAAFLANGWPKPLNHRVCCDRYAAIEVGSSERGLPLPHKDIAKGRSKALVGQGRRPPPIVSCSQIPTAATADRLHTPAVPLKFHDRLTRLRTTLLHEKKWPDRATSCTRVSAGGRGRWGSPTGRAPWRCPPCPPRSRRNHRPSRSTAGRRRAQRPRQWRGRPATRGAPPGQNPTVGCRGRRHRRRRVV